ncbi:MAG: flagellar hook assembly protein FlgD [Candidatus Tectomicrobia bacterium]|nr:flagellar hook assembly protein FlgD [Candidatus Tectomicrobia bacterium]
MVAVTSVESAAAKQAAGASASSVTKGLSQQDFLRLLIVQMQNQDPLNPQDPIEFTTQLTQFSQLEQLLNINKGLEDMKKGQQSLQSVQAAGYIGKTVRAKGFSVQVAGGQSTPISYALASDAATVTIQVRDASGKVVRTLEQSLVKGGTQTVAFDGKDTLGRPLPDGTYEISVTAQDKAGKPVKVELFRTGVVTGVSLEGEEPTLLVGNQKVKLSDVLEFSAAPGA